MNTLRIYPHTDYHSFRNWLYAAVWTLLFQRLSPMEVKVAFEKAFWKLEPKLS